MSACIRTTRATPPHTILETLRAPAFVSTVVILDINDTQQDLYDKPLSQPLSQPPPATL